MSITALYGTILTPNKPDQTVLENIIWQKPEKGRPESLVSIQHHRNVQQAKQ